MSKKRWGITLFLDNKIIAKFDFNNEEEQACDDILEICQVLTHKTQHREINKWSYVSVEFTND